MGIFMDFMMYGDEYIGTYWNVWLGCDGDEFGWPLGILWVSCGIWLFFYGDLWECTEIVTGIYD
jgi:hypothetical protein